MRGIEPGVPAVLIENAPGSGDTPVAGSGARVRASSALDADAPMVLYTGTFEAYQGLDLLFAAARQRARARPDARFVLAGGRPDQIEAARAAGGRAGIGAADVFAGQRPAEEIPRVPRRGRRARLAAQPGHEHAAEDLPVPPLRPPDRRHAPADAHAGARRRGGDPDRGDAEAFRRRHPGGDRRSGARPRRSAPARAQLADTKYSYEAYLARTRQACAHLVGDVDAAGGRGCGVTVASAAARRSLQLRRLRRSRDGGALRRAALQRPDRPADRRDAGASDRRVPRRRSTGRTVLDVGTGTGRAAIALARARRARHRRRRVGGDAASPSAGRRPRASSVDVHRAATRTASRFADRSFDAVICLRVLMHTPDWRQSLGELCRVARDRVVFDYPALLERRGAPGGGSPAPAHAFGAPVEAYRVFSDARGRAPRSRRSGFRVTGAHRQFVLPIALHKRLNSAAATARIEGALARAGLTRLLGSPVTVVAERCAS